jgi:hypothetical protein
MVKPEDLVPGSQKTWVMGNDRKMLDKAGKD